MKVTQRFTYRMSFTIDVDCEVEEGANDDWVAFRTAHMEVPMKARNVEIKTTNRRYLDTPQPEPIQQPDAAPFAPADQEEF